MSADLVVFSGIVPRRAFLHTAPLRRRIARPSAPGSRPRASSDGGSYLEMWKNAVDRERKSQEFIRLAGTPVDADAPPEESLQQKIVEFNKILDVPNEERDHTQRLQVIDRTAAAIAAAQAILKDFTAEDSSGDHRLAPSPPQQGSLDESPLLSGSGVSVFGTPGPDFWSWSPGSDVSCEPSDATDLQPELKLSKHQIPQAILLEKEYNVQPLSIPWESTYFESKPNPPLPPLESFVEVQKIDRETCTSDIFKEKVETKIERIFSSHAMEAAEALNMSGRISSLTHGINADGTKWWRQTGAEERSDGVVCKWTLIRGISADESVEWEDKYWEASDQFDYKELGSEKSGRNASGNVWREYWKESIWQVDGLTHIEKTADKWGKNGEGGDWHEKWWEHYDASGQAEKWAHKRCHLDPNTPLDPGHAHTWNERWGEKYDGRGGCMKYTDKWAERSEGEGGGWSKWGDKWDEHFGQDGRGVKQGETWWEGRQGERWNRTWGEGHGGFGWVHKYGRSSSGEHWDTHVQQETWYEPRPHHDFHHCLENSIQLRAVPPRPPAAADEEASPETH